MEEVNKKADDFRKKKPKKAWEKFCKKPVEVVRGPGGNLFITDHHHGALAWLRAEGHKGLCKVVEGPPFKSEAEFWSGLQDGDKTLVHLKDANGKTITPEQLPRSLEALPDDPYRSLAWRLRHANVFCRDENKKEFAEFDWADWLRERMQSAGDFERAKDLATSAAAKDLPGYVGKKPKSFKCGDKDDD